MVVFAGDGATAMIDKNNGVSAKLKTMKVFEGTTSFLSLLSILYQEAVRTKSLKMNYRNK
jgi:hypothetical protein